MKNGLRLFCCFVMSVCFAVPAPAATLSADTGGALENELSLLRSAEEGDLDAALQAAKRAEEGIRKYLKNDRLEEARQLYVGLDRLCWRFATAGDLAVVHVRAMADLGNAYGEAGDPATALRHLSMIEERRRVFKSDAKMAEWQAWAAANLLHALKSTKATISDKAKRAEKIYKDLVALSASFGGNRIVARNRMRGAFNMVDLYCRLGRPDDAAELYLTVSAPSRKDSRVTEWQLRMLRALGYDYAKASGVEEAVLFCGEAWERYTPFESDASLSEVMADIALNVTYACERATAKGGRKVDTRTAVDALGRLALVRSRHRENAAVNLSVAKASHNVVLLYCREGRFADALTVCDALAFLPKNVKIARQQAEAWRALLKAGRSSLPKGRAESMEQEIRNLAEAFPNDKNIAGAAAELTP